MADGADGNFLYGMEVGTGVFGGAQIVEIPQAGGGYRRRAQMNLTVTRSQTQFVFEPKTKLVRLATGNMPAITYVIDSVDTNDPLAWVLVLVRAGA
jgi:hypothetical protein